MAKTKSWASLETLTTGLPKTQLDGKRILSTHAFGLPKSWNAGGPVLKHQRLLTKETVDGKPPGKHYRSVPNAKELETQTEKLLLHKKLILKRVSSNDWRSMLMEHIACLEKFTFSRPKSQFNETIL